MEKLHRVCKNFTRHDKKTRTILLCEMLEYTNVFLEAAFRAEGYSFETLKNPVKDRTLALRYISNDYCYPTVLILAQFLEYLESGERDPEEITVQATRENKPDILQYRIEVPSDKKVDAIAAIIRAQQLDRVICFCNTKGSTERLTKFLQLRGLDAQCIHGDIPQRKREEVMARFRDGELHVFVATDVASRGIDVDDVDAVFNFEVPEENEYYIHRIGRTGRARKHGVAYTLLSDFPSRMRLDDIARNTRSQIIPAVLGEDGQVTPAENKSK